MPVIFHMQHYLFSEGNGLHIVTSEGNVINKKMGTGVNYY